MARHGRLRRSCHRARRAEGAWTCSRNSSWPPGRKTRRISASVAGRSMMPSTNTLTTVSMLSSAMGSRSAGRDADVVVTDPRSELVRPRGDRFDEGQAAEARGVVRQVPSHTGPDLEHVTTGRGEQAAPPLRIATHLCGREDPVVQGGVDPSSGSGRRSLAEQPGFRALRGRERDTSVIAGGGVGRGHRGPPGSLALVASRGPSRGTLAVRLRWADSRPHRNHLVKARTTAANGSRVPSAVFDAEVSR